MPDNQAIKARLEARLVELGAEVEKLEGEFTQPLDADSEEQANQLEDMETNEALEAAHVQEARQIRAALNRIREGNYGTCANCGDAIAPARLEALPTATLCINCAP
ncbi:TraR/DksA family transcriptional regulator [Sandaracinobacteroides sp. A072]|uniref:TraR/DksA family transcriptional regulator n=1 Tax=Sandaracinobacteroides sp. A072 TaxID=3461146 RepID=UPI004041C082